MVRTILLALALALGGGAGGFGNLLQAGWGAWAADAPNGAGRTMTKAGNGADPSGLTTDAGNRTDPNGVTPEAGGHADPNG